MQGERELVSDCRSLARFELRGIPPMAAGAARIRITYQVDADGLLSVSARETRSGVEASITVKPSYGLADDEMARMLQESYARAEVDMQMRALREEQVEAERILLATQSALDADAALLSDDERAEIAALLASLRSYRAGQRPPGHQAKRSRRWPAAPRSSPPAGWTAACARRWPAASSTRLPDRAPPVIIKPYS